MSSKVILIIKLIKAPSWSFLRSLLQMSYKLPDTIYFTSVGYTLDLPTIQLYYYGTEKARRYVNKE